MNFYKGDIEPEPGTIFVFGSNPEGRHGAGAARVACEKFGAIYGQGEGLQGNSYAIPTKDLRIPGTRSIPPAVIVENIKRFYEVARSRPDLTFKVAYRNTTKPSLNGYTGIEMLGMFLYAGEPQTSNLESLIPDNVLFSEEWENVLKEFNLI